MLALVLLPAIFLSPTPYVRHSCYTGETDNSFTPLTPCGRNFSGEHPSGGLWLVFPLTQRYVNGFYAYFKNASKVIPPGDRAGRTGHKQPPRIDIILHVC